MPENPSRLRVALALATVYVLWGSTYLAIRFAIETLPPFSMAGVRFTLAGALLYLIARATGAPRPERRNWAAAAFVGTLLLMGGNGGVVWAEQRVDSGIAALLVTTVPLWMTLVDWLRPGGRRPGWKVVLGLVLGFAGVVLLVRPGSGGAVRIDPLGAAVLVLGSLSWAFGSIGSRHVPLPRSPLLATAMEMLSGGAVLLLAGAAAGEPAAFHPAAVSGRSLAALAYLVVFGAIVGYTAYVWLLRAAPPALVSTYAYVNPVVAVFLGWAFAGEAISGRTLLASLVIIAGVAVITLSQAGKREAEAPATPALAPEEPARAEAEALEPEAVCAR